MAKTKPKKLAPFHGKGRFGFRVAKQRYSVFRAQHQLAWEKVFENLVRRLCKQNNLDVDEHLEAGKRKWQTTYETLHAEGYRFRAMKKEHSSENSGIIEE
jgi:hypothetical protein